MKTYKLDNISFSILGNAAHFLNGLTSNTLEAPQNAFLNQHGRIIAVFFQKQISVDECWISVPRVAVEPLLKHLDRYAKLSHAKIVPSGQHLFMDLDTAQPRWDAVDHPDSINEEEFTLFRLDHDIPLMGVDYQADEFVLNVHEHRYVSYTKGCFLGQEPVAKVHNRSKPTRKLVVRQENECTPQEAAQMSSKAMDPATKRIKGFVFVGNRPS